MRSRATSGFTLLEVVLAMTSLALVMAICYGALHLALRAVEKGEVAVVETQRLRVTSDILIRQLKSVVPYPARDEDGEPQLFFNGTASSIQFVTSAGLGNGGGLALVEYRTEQDPPRLVMRESSTFSPDSLGRGEDPHFGDPVVILDGFTRLTFQYLVLGDSEKQHQWDRDEGTLPFGIRLYIEGLEGGEPQFSQDLPLMTAAFGDGESDFIDNELQDADDEDEAPDPNGPGNDGSGNDPGGLGADGVDGGDQ